MSRSVNFMIISFCLLQIGEKKKSCLQEGTGILQLLTAQKSMTPSNTHFHLQSMKLTLFWRRVSLMWIENKLKLHCFWEETTNFYLW